MNGSFQASIRKSNSPVDWSSNYLTIDAKIEPNGNVKVKLGFSANVRKLTHSANSR